MANRTPFYDAHLKANAKMVNFSGWEMPLHYGSQLQEHHQVRKDAGLFDVSHMGVVDLQGPDVQPYLRRLLANNIDRLTDGAALYSCMLNEQGGVIDDLIVYKIADDYFRIVINAGTRDKDISWMKKQLTSFNLTLTERTDLAMLAIQGPQVFKKVEKFMPEAIAEQVGLLKPFTFLQYKELFIARTGYTGEDGYEIIFPVTEANRLWDRLTAEGIVPCGLGARDTLRLEAGLNLYGSDMDEKVSPLESNLAWTVVMEPKDRQFIGREALEKQASQGVKYRLVGLVLDGPGVIRNHQKVVMTDGGEGEVTSGGYAPTLEKSIALARIPANGATSCSVEIRNKQVPAMIVKPPFVKKGKVLV